MTTIARPVNPAPLQSGLLPDVAGVPGKPNRGGDYGENERHQVVAKAIRPLLVPTQIFPSRSEE